jgi:hypothetical protein
MDPLAELGGEVVERLAAGAGESDDGALRVQGLGDGAADAPGSACDQRGFTSEIEHGADP